MQTSNKLIKVAHSPDSDDAFMFYAIAHKKIDLKGYDFSIDSEEIAKLNEYALDISSGKTAAMDADIFAVSFHAYAYIAKQYQILRSGASMGGEDYGPRIVAKQSFEEIFKNNGKLRIAIPGKLTSAYLVWKIYCSEVLKIDSSQIEEYFCSFNEVFDLLETKEVNASLLIHESQLKYEENQCQLLLDLGAWWFKRTSGLSMPLGCNVINRSLGEKAIAEISKILQESIAYGLENFEETLEYARSYAKNDLDDKRAKKYISMYVNDKTRSLKDEDLKSIGLMYKAALENDLFLDNVGNSSLILDLA